MEIRYIDNFLHHKPFSACGLVPLGLCNGEDKWAMKGEQRSKTRKTPCIGIHLSRLGEKMLAPAFTGEPPRPDGASEAGRG